ncbi:MAG: UvrD-helicase domain-containing protein [Planctomycetia bacterium]|nr:UvrD-helicase domain-containing protein [Planctomycetia bacterium]
MNPLLENLNDSQKEAVQHKDGPMLVLAGPGSGKTRVVTHRIAWLVEQGVPPWRIAALTFTNKAAEEMKNRIAALIPGKKIWIGTFHRFCSFLLRSYAPYVGLNSNFTIYDMDESRQILDSLIDKQELPNGVDSAKVAATISWAKNALMLPENYQAQPGSPLGKYVEKIYPLYQKALKNANAVDFDDLLVHFAVLLGNNPDVRSDLDHRYQYILVDEYQDTNLVQYAIARALSVDYPNLCVTGDPDQSIYGWRGANIRNILEFEKDFENVKTIRLEENYRSTPEILAAASALIKHNVFRKEKDLFTNNAAGHRPRVLVCEDHHAEAESIAREIASEIESGKRRAQDYAIFYRMNALSRNLEHALRRFGVPFQLIRGLEFFNRKEIKDIIAYLQLIYNPNDTVSFNRVINTPVRGLGKITVHRIEEYAGLRGLSLLDAARNLVKLSSNRQDFRKRKKVEVADSESENKQKEFFPTRAPSLTKKAANALENFVQLIDRFRELAKVSDLELLLSIVLKETGYLQALQVVKTEEEQQRLANVQELLSEVREFDRMFDEEKQNQTNSEESNYFGEYERLGRFLETAALTSDVDAWESDSDRVSLMTLHAAKGLEFPVVYIIALEENILPHERSSKDKSQLEEERRLLFVGMTRAEQELRISRTRFREYRGMLNSSILSRFLFDFPPELLEITSPEEAFSYHKEDIPGKNSDQEEGPVLFEPVSKITVYEEMEEEKPVPFEKTARKRKAKRPDPAEYEGIDEEVVYEEEADIVYDDEGRAHRVLPAKKQKPKSEKTVDYSLPGVSLGVELVSKSNPLKSRSGGKREYKTDMVVRHKNYGVGIIKAICGPKEAQIATIEFLSGVGQVDVELSDPLLY